MSPVLLPPPLALPPLPSFGGVFVVSLGGYFLGLPRFLFGCSSVVETAKVGFALGKEDFLFPGVFFVGATFPTAEPLLGPVPTFGSGVGLQLEELDRLHEVGLRTSFRELSTERGLLSEEEDV